MKALKIAVIALCLHAPFTNTMSMNDQCPEHIAFTGIATLATGGLAIMRYRDLKPHNQEMQRIRAKYDKQRKELDIEADDVESNTHDVRRPSLQTINASENKATEIEEFDFSCDDPAPFMAGCCCGALWFGWSALQSCLN